MQDIGGKEDTDSSRRTQHSDGGSCVSNPLDTVSLLEIGCFFPREGSREAENPRQFLSPEEHPISALSAAWSLAEAWKNPTGPVN
jgi:hypothetical protein